jgi:D-glycero-alpha-D-manno-heptose-7-phosphate kinase
VIITRTPLRISLGGGGTDLPSYYSRFGGFVMSAAINRYIYIAIHRSFTPNYIIKYAQMEKVDRVEDIAHPMVRKALELHNVGPYLEVASMADIPAGTGLGSSGSFGVGFLRGLYALKHEHVSPATLAEEACHIEMNLLHEPVGKQDQYIAAVGGMVCLDIDREGVVQVTPLRIGKETLHDLEDNLLLFFTGYTRSASNVLGEQKSRSEKDDPEMLDNLHFIRDLGLRTKRVLEEGRTGDFAALMHEHWMHKRKRSAGITNGNIDRWYELARENGALGGKLIGAGGGGFLMFYAEDRGRLRKTLAAEGLEEVRFAFDFEGSRVIVLD